MFGIKMSKLFKLDRYPPRHTLSLNSLISVTPGLNYLNGLSRLISLSLQSDYFIVFLFDLFFLLGGGGPGPSWAAGIKRLNHFTRVRYPK